VVICLEQGTDLHMVQLIPLPLTVSCSNKIQIGFTFLVPAHPGSPGQRAVKCVCVFVCRPELPAITREMLLRRRVLPSTSTPIGCRVQPAVALNRGATFSGYDSKLRSNLRDQIDAVNGCQGSGVRCADTTANCSAIQFSPDRQHCSTPAAGRGPCVPAILRTDLAANASFHSRLHCSTDVGRHLSVNRSSIACFDDPRRKPEKSSGSFLSGSGLGFLQKLSRGSAHPASPNCSSMGDTSTVGVKRRSSFRDSFKKIFFSRRFV